MRYELVAESCEELSDSSTEEEETESCEQLSTDSAEEVAAWDQSLHLGDVRYIAALRLLLDALLRPDQPLKSLSIHAVLELRPGGFAGCEERLSGLTALRLSSDPHCDNTLAWQALWTQVPHLKSQD